MSNEVSNTPNPPPTIDGFDSTGDQREGAFIRGEIARFDRPLGN
jgi:hypothetical protein